MLVFFTDTDTDFSLKRSQGIWLSFDKYALFCK